MQIKARAKINWALNVLGSRTDGYHHLDMLNQRLTLADDVFLSPAHAIELEVRGNKDVPDNHSNLAWQAASMLKRRFDVSEGVNIRLHKRIPPGAGLAGGSADAAAVLLGLNRLWGLGLALHELREFGKGLGADIPYCLAGGFARVGGIGEIITPLTNAPELRLVLIKPRGALSTRIVFECYNGLATTEPADIPGLNQALSLGAYKELYVYARNQLQPAAVSLCPEVHEAIRDLQANGAVFAQMTGSGSLVYGVFEDDGMAQMAYQKLSLCWHTCLLTRTAGA
ncbi:MAG: 4-(cytidine 5'-diphospho)-2-C-methyl-D-erythritol kinase [Clostridiales bacterium]|jgi:4-diphosphocytidyl-2-C-methyl-D-erythritol kinase|nr:4-(cytidine 5'-diphospho)-2-C-methyl-D-erythritol kinase [Clostridiales bacterium]